MKWRLPDANVYTHAVTPPSNTIRYAWRMRAVLNCPKQSSVTEDARSVPNDFPQATAMAENNLPATRQSEIAQE
jgi:hypothetical protein